MDAEKIAKRAQEIAEEIKDRRMVFTDQDWPDDTGDQYDKVYQYAYYIYCFTPVRVFRNDRTAWAGAEKLNFMTGQFDYNNELLINIEFDTYKGGADTEEVFSKAEFYKLCEEFMANYTPERVAKEEKMRERNEIWMRKHLAKKKEQESGG